MRVLVVDDKEENLYYLQALLGGHGCEVDTARHGAEALLKARQLPPALVISDLLMPVMDGYTLLRHWKADEHLKKVPFVVYTATYTDPEDEELALRLGADAFVLKPAEPEAFVARVRAVQAGGAGARTPAAREPSGDEVRLYRDYSETLIRKLEEKTLQLEHTNQCLQRDIAARKTVEEALRESEERFRQLAENIDDVFWLSDLEHAFIYVSPAYEAVWGRSRESLLASPEGWLETLHDDDRRRAEEARMESVHGPCDETYRIFRPDGSVRWVRARTYPVRDASGRPYRIAGVARDITSYRLLEEQFRQAQKLEAIGRLAGGVAHDFNNLLSVVLSYTSLALNALNPADPIRGDLEEVRRAGERATALTRQLLAFSRRQMLRPRVLDLGQVVRDMEKMLRRLLGEDITLLIIASGQAGRVYVDPGQMEQIVMNLAVNARDAMPTGGKLTIEITSLELRAAEARERSVLAPGRYVLLTVTDTGSGMDETTLDRIFEPFFTTKELGKGTGLGLSTVFGIVTQSRGHIEVKSSPGVGTTFEIYLPCSEEAAEIIKASLPAPGNLRGTETVLLVEDDQQVREVNRTILRRNGYNVLDARDAEDAIALSAQYPNPIDLLLTDVVMPHMSGRELAERLSATRPTMKVLYVSGYTQSAVVHHHVVDTGIHFLQKPTTPDALLSKVREILEVPPEVSDP